jgi:catechol 2,3-dioxygenase-like lactoylglutathione lyase family enzyme
MTTKVDVRALVAVVALVGAGPETARAAEAKIHQVYITASSPAEGVRWYTRHMKCESTAERGDTAKCGPVELIFVAQPTMGSTQGTGVNHIGFSFADLKAKMTELEKVGVSGAGVRLQRFPDGSMFRDVPGLFKIGFIFDPWGTRIELVEDTERLGFHHIHLAATDPAATLKWYRSMFGGKPAKLKGQLDGLLFDGVWLLASRHEEGAPATTEGRAIDQLAFVVRDFDKAAADLRRQGATFLKDPTSARSAGANVPKGELLAGPDNVRLAVVEPGFTRVAARRAGSAVATDPRGSYTTPRTPWGEPNLQGVWTGNSAHGIPLERPNDQANVNTLTAEQAEARRERGTLGSIWGYDREWRDTTLGYVKTAPSTQVAMVIDPPDGRLPPLTPEGLRRAEESRRAAASEETARGGGAYGLPEGPEDLSPYVRCITRGLPAMMTPSIYNNGLQIVQGPGYVTIQKEMVHETRVIPTKPRPRLGSDLPLWLGDSQGRWEGETLVVETTNFNGRASFRGSSAAMRLIERYTRIAPNVLEYRFTVEDPQTWTRPWTAMFTFDKDDDQYELVEYACHEGNYGMTNILSGARAREKELQGAPKK